ncbi:hypothetical protein KSP39_PZI007686 [Platanthera zijinensis]|uniref:Uncharacterized protein n=1 Tax=Platanthera zijinensis TaxID=2320716 RepID=A0AAP0BMH6_9ASPA
MRSLTRAEWVASSGNTRRQQHKRVHGSLVPIKSPQTEPKSYPCTRHLCPPRPASAAKHSSTLAARNNSTSKSRRNNHCIHNILQLQLRHNNDSTSTSCMRFF